MDDQILLQNVSIGKTPSVRQRETYEPEQSDSSLGLQIPDGEARPSNESRQDDNFMSAVLPPVDKVRPMFQRRSRF